MYTCFDVAYYLLEKAEKEGQGMDPMKLLKLAYICHGYNLAFNDQPLFSNQVQAWKYGTVIPDLYHVVKRFGSGLVDREIVGIWKDNDIEGKQKDLIDRVWDAYKKFSGLQLSELTHQAGSPWSATHNGAQNVPIPNELIQAHYKQIVNNPTVSYAA